LGDAILFTAGFDDCVSHTMPLEKKERESYTGNAG
jgi:hypothetical protein